MSNETKNRLRELLGEEEFARLQKEGCASVAREKAMEHGCQCKVTDFQTDVEEHYSEFIVIGFKPATKDGEEGIEMCIRAACDPLQLHEATKELTKVTMKALEDAPLEVLMTVFMDMMQHKMKSNK